MASSAQGTDEDDDETGGWWAATLLLILFVVALLLGGPVYWFWNRAVYHPEARWLALPSDDRYMDARGNVIAALFSGFAFVGVVVAIILQSYELSLQRRELKATKKALQQAANAQTAQTTELQAQTTHLRQQLTLTETVSASQQFFDLVKFLNEYRDDRKTVFALADQNLPYERWHSENKPIGERVCTTFNLAGIMARRGGVLMELIVDSYHESAAKAWWALHPLLMEIRNRRGPDYCKEFDWLVNEAPEMRKQAKTDRPA
jgi:Tfp pilus assembly protein PilE